MMPVPAPREADWERIKPIFIDLYIRQEETLDDVMRILSRDHGFIASKKAFKTHITRWQAFKNYKAAEKRDLIRQREHHLEQFGSFAHWQHRGSPIKWDRVDRHIAVSPTNCLIPSTGSLQPGQSQRRDAGVPLIATHGARYTATISQSLQDPSECLLSKIKDLYTFQINTQLVLPGSDGAKLDFSIYNDLYHAFGLINHPSTTDRAFSILRALGDTIPVALSAKPFVVLHTILRLPNFLGKGADKVVERLFRLICRSAVRLPEHNLLKAVLMRVNDLTALQEELPRIGWVHLETVWSHRRMLLDTSRVEVLIDAIYSNKRHMLLESVQSHAIDLMQVNTIHPFNFCQLTLLLTTSYLEQDTSRCYNLALDAATDALSRLNDVDLKASTPHLVSRKGYFVVQLQQRVARCHDHLGNFVAGAEAYRQAFESASCCFGAESDRARLGLLEWESFLSRHQSSAEQSSLVTLQDSNARKMCDTAENKF